MTLSNITDRGTLRGVIYRGAGSGTTDYTQLSNKPQINGHTLQGNQSGDDLDLIDKGSIIINSIIVEGNHTGDYYKLINDSDLKFNEGWAGTILHNIKFKNTTYAVYASPFSGASSGSNGTMGLVPAPLSSQGDYDKFLKGNGRWATPPKSSLNTTLLYDSGSPIYGCAFNTVINLLDNLSNYDAAIIEWNTQNDRTADAPMEQTNIAWALVSQLLRSNFQLTFTGYYQRWARVLFTDTTFKLTARGGDAPPTIYKIWGLKIS